MSRSIAVIIVILFLVVAGFAYWNYDRLNKIQNNLLEKDIILEESKELIEKQEKSINQLEEQIKESRELIQPIAENDLVNKPEEVVAKQLSQFQEEYKLLQKQLAEYEQEIVALQGNISA